MPSAPSHLNPEGRREWKRITGELAPLGMVAKIDRAALAVYCQAYGRWVHAEVRLKKLGDEGLVAISPSGCEKIGSWLKISDQAVQTMEKFLSHFGMSPSSRSRVSFGPKQELFADGDEAPNPAARYFT